MQTSPRLRNPRHGPLRLFTVGLRSGLTLAELLISMTILSLMAVVLAGMSNAVNSAWSYTQGLEEADLGSRAALERISYMVSQTGVYKVPGQPTRLGMAVVSRTAGSTSVPDVLVLWTGGRNGGLATQGVQSRLPKIGELLIYTWDAAHPNVLLELAFPNQTAPFDFAASDLSSTVTQLIASNMAERMPLCERLRVSTQSSAQTETTSPGTSFSSGFFDSSGYTGYPGGSPSWPFSQSGSAPSASPNSSIPPIGCVRFTLSMTPTDGQLAAVSPNTTAWTQLNWPQSLYSSNSGIRQATLSIELQVEPDGIARASDTVTAIPFFDSAIRRYVYEP
jgi:Tfp pilus assembly protein PilV